MTVTVDPASWTGRRQRLLPWFRFSLGRHFALQAIVYRRWPDEEPGNRPEALGLSVGYSAYEDTYGITLYVGRRRYRWRWFTHDWLENTLRRL